MREDDEEVKEIGVALDLNFSLYISYHESIQCLKYINMKSNHHKSIFESIIKSISIRISDLSATEDVFYKYTNFSLKFRLILNTRLKEHLSKLNLRQACIMNIGYPNPHSIVRKFRPPSIHIHDT